MKKFSDRKKVLISGYYGFGNFGDEAILGVLINKLHENDVIVRVLTAKPDQTAKEYNVGTTFFCCFCRFLPRIKECDVLISGGGSLLQDVTSIRSLIYYLTIIKAALFFKKKVIIFAQGIGPIKSKLGQFLTKRALKKCSLVTVRDEKSLFLLRGWGINAELVCDPLFDLKMTESFPSNKVGIQLRGFKTVSEKLLIKLAEQVNKEFSDKNIEIYSFQDSLDLEVCKRFERMLKSINPNISTNLIYKQSTKDILDKLSKLDYMIAMRFHANLIALKYGVKTLAIAYDEKVEKLAKEAEIPCLSMLANENYDEYFAQLKDLNKNKLKEFSESKHFDWEKFLEVIENA